MRIFNRFKYKSSTNWEDANAESELDQLDTGAAGTGVVSQAKKADSTKNPIQSPKVEIDANVRLSEDLLSGLSVDELAVAEKSAGFLTVKSNNKKFGDPWERKYFVLRGSHLFYYNNKRAFELESAKPINKRPIELEGYALVLTEAAGPPYSLLLEPEDPDDIRRSWEFRCDTVSEYEFWVELITSALQQYETNQVEAAAEVQSVAGGKTVKGDGTVKGSKSISGRSKY